MVLKNSKTGFIRNNSEKIEKIDLLNHGQKSKEHQKKSRKTNLLFFPSKDQIEDATQGQKEKTCQ